MACHKNGKAAAKAATMTKYPAARSRMTLRIAVPGSMPILMHRHARTTSPPTPEGRN
jgi:hypothetical protein